MEHRWGRRIVVDIPVLMTNADSSLNRLAQLANLSITGALIKADFLPRVLSRVQIVFGSSLNRQGHLLIIPAYVVHNHQHGIGVEWLESASPAVTDLVGAASAQLLAVQDGHPVSHAITYGSFTGNRAPWVPCKIRRPG
jgi:hypothetical protein